MPKMRWWLLALAGLTGLAGAAVQAAETEPQADPVVGQFARPRPDADGVPTRVTLGFMFVDVVEVNDLTQEFTADVFFRMRWHDPRLALPADTGNRGERVFPVSEVWSPQPGSLNRREIEKLLPDVVTVDADGLVTYLQRAYGSFAVRMDLRSFPRDRQTLEVQIASYRYSPEEVEFEIEELSGLVRGLAVTGWQVEVGEPNIGPMVIGGSGREFAGATFRLIATREVDYYILTMALPLFFIAAMAWGVFWLDPSLLPPRTGISTAAVFSLIAFRFSLKVSLPRISYLTTADWYVLAATILVFGTFGHVILVARTAKMRGEEQARKIDRWGRWGYALLLAGLLVVSFL
jgi:hypothetical protein